MILAESFQFDSALFQMILSDNLIESTIISYDMIWYDMIWYDMIWYDMIWYTEMKYNDSKWKQLQRNMIMDNEIDIDIDIDIDSELKIYDNLIWKNCEMIWFWLKRLHANWILKSMMTKTKRFRLKYDKMIRMKSNIVNELIKIWRQSLYEILHPLEIFDRLENCLSFKMERVIEQWRNRKSF
jgi:hypothetical protein